MYTKNKGSVTLEATLILPICILVIICMAAFIKCILVWNNVQYALNMTSRLFADYAIIYHQNGVAKFGDKLLGKVVDTLKLDQLPPEISKYLDARNLINEGDDVLYGIVAKSVFEYYFTKINEAQGLHLSIDKVSFLQSDFFNGNEDVSLCITYTTNINVPLPKSFLSGFKMTNFVKCRAWLNGEYFNVWQENIWKIDNLKRGIIIRERFGGTLPSNFPVIASFIDGEIMMIKSLDTTANSYLDYDVLDATLKSMALDLMSYNGQEKPWGKDKIVISSSDIKRRCLRLVIPENNVVTQQKLCLDNFKAYCEGNGILLDIVKYQSKV